MRVAMVGAGGHGRATLDCFRQMRGGDPAVVFFDDRFPMLRALDGAEVRGTIEDLLQSTEPWDGVFVSIGENVARMRTAVALTQQRRPWIRIVHPHTAVSPSARIEEGTIAVAGVVVNAAARVGRFVILNTLSSVGHDCVVEDFAQLGPGVNLGGGVTIEEGAFLGIGTKVVPEARVGAWSIVGAGSVVLDDLPPRSFCLGMPARVVRPLRADELP